MKRVLAILVAVTLLFGCAPRDPIGHATVVDETRSSATYSLASGSQLELGTVVGFHLDLGEQWGHTDGAPEMGYLYLENAELGCSLALMVATPISDFPHHKEDEAGSVEILERFGPTGGDSPQPYLYPTLDGETIEMLGVVHSGATGSRIAVAREFGAIDSALMADFVCAEQSDIEQIFTDEISAHFLATLQFG